MNDLTPTAQAILDALRLGPATSSVLRDRTGRGRSTIDKAIAELARHHLIHRTTSIDPDDTTAAAGWTLPAPEADAATGQPATDQPVAAADDELTLDSTPQVGADPHDPDDDSGAPSTPDASPTDHATMADQDRDIDGRPADEEASRGQEDDQPATPQISARSDPTDDYEPKSPPPDADPQDVKICRGCQTQMPTVCPCCRAKTTAYCGTCRQDRPSGRPRVPGEPETLANGLPKLARGELERLVLDVMATHPLPDHVGVTGWTPGRLAVYLPGRSTGALGNVLDKLAATGRAHLLGESPKRYQLTPDPDPQPDHQDDSLTDESGGQEDTAHADPASNDPHDQPHSAQARGLTQ